MHPVKTIAAIAAFSLLGVAAQAASYKVDPMIDKGSFLGCMAVNQTDGIVIVGVETGLSLMVEAPEFKVAKGDAVAGTWAVDDGKQSALADKANGAGVVSIDLPLTRENFELVANGDELTVSLGKAKHSFSLEGSSKGLEDLTSCMNKHGA
jgi:hypothetical protein